MSSNDDIKAMLKQVLEFIATTKTNEEEPVAEPEAEPVAEEPAVEEPAEEVAEPVGEVVESENVDRIKSPHTPNQEERPKADVAAKIGGYGEKVKLQKELEGKEQMIAELSERLKEVEARLDEPAVESVNSEELSSKKLDFVPALLSTLKRQGGCA